MSGSLVNWRYHRPLLQWYLICSTVKNLKKSGTQNNYHNFLKIIIWTYTDGMRLNDVMHWDGKQYRSRSNCSLRSSLIWVCIVCWAFLSECLESLRRADIGFLLHSCGIDHTVILLWPVICKAFFTPLWCWILFFHSKQAFFLVCFNINYAF